LTDCFGFNDVEMSHVTSTPGDKYLHD
jgi:hypothetical protein